MKKLILLVLAGGLLLQACGDDKEKEKESDDATTENASTETSSNESEDASTASVGLTLDESMDLSEFELPIVMDAPANSTAVDEYGVEVSNGETFNIKIDEDFYDSVDERRQEFEENDVNVVKSFVVDEENGFISENEVMGQTEYHFFYLISNDEHTYAFENVKGRSFSLAEIELMYEAAKSAVITE